MFAYPEGKKGIIYTINKRHNERVCTMFVDAGIIAKAINSDTNHEERNRIVKDFKNGNIQILCNVNIFSEGFDCPDVEFIQLARPTKSLSMYLQQVGRGFRIHEDKEKVIFLDNVGLFNRFGLPSANRKWLKHFNGSKDSEEYSKDNNYNENVIFIEIDIDIEEGNEEFELIFNSNLEDKNIITTEFEVDEIEDFDLIVYDDKSIDLNSLNSKEDKYFFGLLLNYDELLYDSLYDSLIDEYDEKYNDSSFVKRYTHIKKIVKNNKLGLWNESESELVLEPIYDEIIFHSVFSQVLLNKDGKYGVFNPFTKNIEIPTIYDDIEKLSFMPNYHIIESNKKFGVISKVNNLFIEPFSDCIIEFNRYFNIKTEPEWLLFNSDLKKIEFKHFELFENFGEYFIVKYQNMFGFSNKEKLLYPFLIKSYKIISENRIIIEYKESGFCVFNKNLKFVINLNFYSTIEVIGKRFFKVKKNDKFGIYKFNGNKILSEDFFHCEIIKNNFIVLHGNKWKSFDLSGNELLTSNKKKDVLKKKYIEHTLPITHEVDDLFVKLQREQNDLIDKILKAYKDSNSNYNNIEKTIRLNKIKSELQITNSEILFFFKSVGVIFIDNPNSKLTESEYEFIKAMKEIIA